MYTLLSLLWLVVPIVLCTACKHRDNTYIRKLQREVRHNRLHDSFYIYMDPEFSNTKTYEEVPAEYRKPTFSLFPDLKRSERRCPKKEETIKLCPHYLEMQYDENRIPNIIIQAKCRCKQCLHINKSHSSRCEQMKYYTRVYRVTGCDENTGFYTYEEVWEPVAVGCQCKIRPVPKTVS